MKLIDLKWWGGSAANAPPPTNHRYWLMDQTIGARFWAKVNCAGTHQPHMKTCCWEWTGGGNGRGYGAIKIDGRSRKVHRLTVSWTLGRWPELDVLHPCDNPVCVRPSHLVEGTHQENMRQMALRGPKEHYARGEEQHSAKLTKELVTEIRCRHTAGEAARKLAKDYSVSDVAILRVVHRKTWKHVP